MKPVPAVVETSIRTSCIPVNLFVCIPISKIWNGKQARDIGIVHPIIVAEAVGLISINPTVDGVLDLTVYLYAEPDFIS
jgi:hypothetical protein